LGESASGEIEMELLRRVNGMLMTPHSEWPVIAQEKDQGNDEASALLIPYFAILALIPALGRFIGTSMVGWYAPILPSLAGALVTYLSGCAMVYVLALIIDALAPNFGARKDFASALKLAVYSCTPVWLTGIFLLVPGLSFLVILGLYGIYLLGVGLPILMRVPSEKVLPFTAVAAGCAVIIAIGLGLIVAPLFGAPA
jgi:Yip1 domain